MSAHAAIASAAEIQVRRAPLGRMAIVAVAYLAIALFSTVYPLFSPLNGTFATATLLDQAVSTLWTLLWLAILLVSLARQPEGRLWKFIFLLMVTQRIHVFQWIPNSVVWSLARLVDPVWVAVLVHFVVTFPTGYLRDRFDRVVVDLGYGLAAAAMLNELLLAGDWWQLGCNPECVRNVFVFWPDAGLHETVSKVNIGAVCLLLIPLVTVALWRHWRAAASAARRTLLPLVVAVPVSFGVPIIEVLSGTFEFGPGTTFFDSPSGKAVSLIAPFILPVGLLVGIVRTRLSRGRVANLVVELGRGVPVGGLRDVLARALDDPSLELAFAAPTGPGFVDASGQPVELPVDDPSRAVTRLERDDELLGVLVHDPAINTEDPGLVEAVGNAARLALENERLAAEVRAQLEEVRASRTRIVEAADAERRRVERDLHDGAQQRLVALALRLEVAKQTTPGAAALLEEATGELQTAIGEVRGLARGVHPTILTEAGLRAAVDALAERTPVPIAVDIPERRYDPQVEATAYFVVAEALTNAARYAAANAVRVTAVEDAGRLILTVGDDGRGGADQSAGSGLRGLSDRLAAVDGRLTISSPPGGGTLIRGELPLETRANSIAPNPIAVALSALSQVRAVPDARSVPRRPGRVRLSSPWVLILFVAASIAGIALVAALPGMQSISPDNGRADTFARPFVYQVPSGSGIRLFPGSLDTGATDPSDHLHVLAAPDSPDGISIWIVKDMILDPCSPQGPLAQRAPGREGMIGFLRSVGGLLVENEVQMTLDGRPATRVDVAAEHGRSGCPAEGMFLWLDTSKPPGRQQVMGVPDGEIVRLIVVDIEGATVAIEIWSREDLDAWLLRANPIVDSIRFLYRPPATPASPTSP